MGKNCTFACENTPCEDCKERTKAFNGGVTITSNDICPECNETIQFCNGRTIGERNQLAAIVEWLVNDRVQHWRGTTLTPNRVIELISKQLESGEWKKQ